MPCFKGLAVSIHTPDGAISEHSIQRQARASRITSYIPVPPAKVPANSLTGKPEQSTFAVSITLLVPGQEVPYSKPKPTSEDPFPRGRTVAGLPGSLGARGTNFPAIPPYVPRTTSPNETLAAYIYFDGRAKEEVATLLRKGEETWVNSRWVSVPNSEGGGLAEREFLFREVGLERWLNGLDLIGKDKAAKIEKRHQKLERKRRVKKEEHDSDDEEERKPRFDRNGILRYGNDRASPIESVMDDRDLLSSSDSDDEPPQAEAAGQIKVALFRVLASGEIKRGEYEPQFDAHDDEEISGQNGGGEDEDVDHTTSFAKPKALDPKSISTQTVTGIDPPDAPYAVFTFLYRGEKQLQKMGILESPEPVKTPSIAKPKSTDFSKLGPLKKAGTKGFTGYREGPTPKKKDSKAYDDEMDSDPDEDDERRNTIDDDATVPDTSNQYLSPEDVRKQGELAEGVRKIKLKRVHSAEAVPDVRKSPHISNADSPTVGTPHSGDSMTATAGSPLSAASHTLKPAEVDPDVSSPFKKHRASLDALDFSKVPPLDPSKPTNPSTDAATNTTSTTMTSPIVASAPLAAQVALPAVDSDDDL